jgi:hypothetical protein
MKSKKKQIKVGIKCNAHTYMRVLLVQLEWFPSMITHQARVSKKVFESCDFLVWDFQGCYNARQAGWLSGHRIHARALGWGRVRDQARAAVNQEPRVLASPEQRPRACSGSTWSSTREYAQAYPMGIASERSRRGRIGGRGLSVRSLSPRDLA